MHIWEERLFVNLLVRVFLQEWAKINRREREERTKSKLGERKRGKKKTMPTKTEV